jgi:hypothetical protein
MVILDIQRSLVICVMVTKNISALFSNLEMKCFEICIFKDFCKDFSFEKIKRIFKNINVHDILLLVAI